jgi:hypothetical protein
MMVGCLTDCARLSVATMIMPACCMTACRVRRPSGMPLTYHGMSDMQLAMQG